MADIVISVENLSKRRPLTSDFRSLVVCGRTLTEDLNRRWARVRRNPDSYLKIVPPLRVVGICSQA